MGVNDASLYPFRRHRSPPASITLGNAPLLHDDAEHTSGLSRASSASSPVEALVLLDGFLPRPLLGPRTPFDERADIVHPVAGVGVELHDLDPVHGPVGLRVDLDG